MFSKTEENKEHSRLSKEKEIGRLIVLSAMVRTFLVTTIFRKELVRLIGSILLVSVIVIPVLRFLCLVRLDI